MNLFLPRLCAVQTANLASVMDAPGPYTVFAPTNEAWDALPEGHLDHLTSEQVGPSTRLNAEGHVDRP